MFNIKAEMRGSQVEAQPEQLCDLERPCLKKIERAGDVAQCRAPGFNP